MNLEDLIISNESYFIHMGNIDSNIVEVICEHRISNISRTSCTTWDEWNKYQPLKDIEAP